MDDTFPSLLAGYRQRAGLSQNGLARAVRASPSTINNLESGQRHPTRELVLQLAAALDLGPAETDALLVAARHAPTVFDRLSPADPDLRVVFDLLASEAIPEDRRQHFRQLLRSAAALCQCPSPVDEPARRTP